MMEILRSFFSILSPFSVGGGMRSERRGNPLIEEGKGGGRAKEEEPKMRWKRKLWVLSSFFPSGDEKRGRILVLFFGS